MFSLSIETFLNSHARWLSLQFFRIIEVAGESLVTPPFHPMVKSTINRRMDSMLSGQLAIGTRLMTGTMMKHCTTFTF